MNFFFDDHRELTDAQIDYVNSWIDKHRPDVAPLLFAPDFIQPTDLAAMHSKQDALAFTERCRRLFPVSHIVSALGSYGLPVPGTRTVLITHDDRKLRQESIDPHYFVLKISAENTLQTYLRQLTTLRLAHYLYRADSARYQWLFDPNTPLGSAPFNLLFSDYHFDGAINFVLVDWEEDPRNADPNVETDYHWETDPLLHTARDAESSPLNRDCLTTTAMTVRTGSRAEFIETSNSIDMPSNENSIYLEF